MKPRTPQAMQSLVSEIRERLPFSLSAEQLCAETCSYGCPLKLLEYMDAELSDWQRRLDEGAIPTLAEVQRLASTSKRIYRVLQKNHLIDEP